MMDEASPSGYKIRRSEPVEYKCESCQQPQATAGFLPPQERLSNSKYQCAFCSEIQSVKKLMYHEDQKHHLSKLVRCPACSELVVESEESFSKHLLNVCSKLTCPLCSVGELAAGKIAAHISEHRHTKPTVCALTYAIDDLIKSLTAAPESNSVTSIIAPLSLLFVNADANIYPPIKVNVQSIVESTIASLGTEEEKLLFIQPKSSGPARKTKTEKKKPKKKTVKKEETPDEELRVRIKTQPETTMSKSTYEVISDDEFVVEKKEEKQEEEEEEEGVFASKKKRKRCIFVDDEAEED